MILTRKEKSLIFLLTFILLLVSACGTKVEEETTELNTEKVNETMEDESKEEVKSSGNVQVDSEVSNEPFTNKFGSATTVCAYTGCNDYIATSGDTNCCTIHSKKCEECSIHIDNDAFYCMDCLESAVKSSNSKTSNQAFTNEFGTATTTCVYTGCSNYIATSGDTNCCTTHSNKCGDCNCYIDGDAAFCISCLSK